jgi:HAD superfamily hydrolase (TIGR01490 family)
MRNVAGRGIALFDLDRTLVPGSSLAVLGRVLVRRGLVPRRALVGQVLRQAWFARRGGDDDTGTRLCDELLVAVRGYEHEPLADAARDAADAVVAGAFPAGRWLIERHLRAGDRGILLSAAPQELVEPVALALGLHDAIGTCGEVVDGRFTGKLTGPFCHGQGKLQRLRGALPDVDLTDAVAYADSVADLPVLTAVGRPVAVNPDRRLLAAAHAAGWPVVHLG